MMKENTYFSNARDDHMYRILTLQKAREKTKTFSPIEVSTMPKDIPVSTSILPLDLSNLDSDLLKWQDFWDHFSSVLDKEAHLNDHEHCCHLIKARTTLNPKSSRGSCNLFFHLTRKQLIASRRVTNKIMLSTPTIRRIYFKLIHSRMTEGTSST